MRKSLKTIILLLLVTLLTASLSVSVFAAKDQFVCKSFSITIDEPANGKALSFSASDSSSGVEIYAVEWYEEAPNGDTKELSSGAKAKLGYSYNVMLFARVVPGTKTAAFAGSITEDSSNVTVNGYDSDYIGVVSKEGTNIKSIVVEYNFGELYEYVDEAEISITVPEVGEKPSYPAISTSAYFSNNGGNSATYYKNGIMWYDKTAGKHMVPGSSDTFKDGHTYTVTIILVTKDGYFFTSDVTGWANSTKVPTSFLHAEMIELETTFIVEHEHTESGWKTDSSNHWTACTECGNIMEDKENHADNNKDGKCDMCAYAVPKKAETSSATSSATSSNASSKAEDSKVEATQPENNKGETGKTDGKGDGKGEDTIDLGGLTTGKDPEKVAGAIVTAILLPILIPGLIYLAMWVIAIIAIIKNQKSKKGE